jgi:hypothetical protein
MLYIIKLGIVIHVHILSETQDLHKGNMDHWISYAVTGMAIAL